MTPQERKVMELALEALERSVATCFDQYAHQQVMSQPDHFINKAITAIKESLAQSEKYPQIAINPEIVGYVAPQRKPLTDEQRFDLLTKFEPYKNKWGAPAILIDMVEAAHGIKDKNTQKTTGENNLSSD